MSSNDSNDSSVFGAGKPDFDLKVDQHLVVATSNAALASAVLNVADAVPPNLKVAYYAGAGILGLLANAGVIFPAARYAFNRAWGDVKKRDKVLAQGDKYKPSPLSYLKTATLSALLCASVGWGVSSFIPKSSEDVDGGSMEGLSAIVEHESRVEKPFEEPVEKPFEKTVEEPVVAPVNKKPVYDDAAVPAGMPEYAQDSDAVKTKSEPHQELRQEPRTEPRPEIQSKIKDQHNSQSELQPEPQPELQPESQPESQLESQPESQPEQQNAPQPETKTESKPYSHNHILPGNFNPDLDQIKAKSESENKVKNKEPRSIYDQLDSFAGFHNESKPASIVPPPATPLIPIQTEKPSYDEPAGAETAVMDFTGDAGIEAEALDVPLENKAVDNIPETRTIEEQIDETWADWFIPEEEPEESLAEKYFGVGNKVIVHEVEPDVQPEILPDVQPEIQNDVQESSEEQPEEIVEKSDAGYAASSETVRLETSEVIARPEVLESENETKNSVMDFTEDTDTDSGYIKVIDGDEIESEESVSADFAVVDLWEVYLDNISCEDRYTYFDEIIAARRTGLPFIPDCDGCHVDLKSDDDLDSEDGYYDKFFVSLDELIEHTTVYEFKPAEYAGGAVFGTVLQRALLDTIAFAEKSQGYDRIFGNGSFAPNMSPEEFRKHPNKKVQRCRNKKVVVEGPSGIVTEDLQEICTFNSEAAGRYMFIHSTYRALMKQGQFAYGFTPWEQDRAAIAIFQKLGITDEVIMGAVESGSFYGIASKMICNQWSALPDKNGKHCYSDKVLEDGTILKRSAPNSLKKLAYVLQLSYARQLEKGDRLEFDVAVEADIEDYYGDDDAHYAQEYSREDTLQGGFAVPVVEPAKEKPSEHKPAMSRTYDGEVDVEEVADMLKIKSGISPR